MPTLTEEENSTEDVQESSSAEGTETENNGKPGGLTGDRCIFLSQGLHKKQSSLLVKSIADFAEDYHKKHPNAEKVEEGDFTDNVLWIYEEENIYYFNPGNCISIIVPLLILIPPVFTALPISAAVTTFESAVTGITPSDIHIKSVYLKE